MSTSTKTCRFIQHDLLSDYPEIIDLAPVDLDRLVDQSPSTAVIFICRHTDLPLLRTKLADRIADQGTQHSKSVSQQLFRHTKPALMTATYQSGGRLMQGIQTILGNARKRGIRNVFILGVADELFASECAKLSARGTFSRSEPLRQISHSVEPPVDDPPELRGVFIGCSVEAQLVRRSILKASSITDPILVTGEAGTGKEIVIQSIDNLGPHTDSKPIKFDCASYRPERVWGWLFGKAATETSAANVGDWEKAAGNTLILEEVDALPLPAQKAAERALSEHVIFRENAHQTAIGVTARVLATSTNNLSDLVSRGLFREELYQLLQAYPIHTPSLRDVPEDIPLLADHFWRSITQDKKATLPKAVSDELARYGWPGNSRELQGFLKHLYHNMRGSSLTVESVQELMAYRTGAQVPHRKPAHHPDRQRHMERVKDMLYASRCALDQLKLLDPNDSTAVTRMQDRLFHLSQEFTNLCRYSSRFFSIQTFVEASERKAKLQYIEALLAENPAEGVAAAQEN